MFKNTSNIKQVYQMFQCHSKQKSAFMCFNNYLNHVDVFFGHDKYNASYDKTQFL